MPDVELVTRLLTLQEEKLLRRYFTDKGYKGVANLRPLGRAGQSGAKVFLVLFMPRSVPFVLKLHSEEEITKEEASINKVKTVFADCLSGEPAFYDKNAHRGAILYKHVGANDPESMEKSSPLSELVFQKERRNGELAPLSQEILGLTIEKLFANTCKTAHSKPSLKKTKLLKEYERYLRKDANKFRTIPRIRTMLGNDVDNDNPTILGEKILNPLMAIQKGFKEEKSIKICHIHGDLHPNNIIIDHEGAPRLIDFAWAESDAHFLKDFVLLENSIRFSIFPRYINEQDQLKVDTLLLRREGAQEIKQKAFYGKITSKLAQDAYLRMADMIDVIRKRACSVGGNRFDFNEYLAAQFLMLYGLMRFDEYNTPTVLRALGMIGLKLHNTEYIPS